MKRNKHINKDENSSSSGLGTKYGYGLDNYYYYREPMVYNRCPFVYPSPYPPYREEYYGDEFEYIPYYPKPNRQRYMEQYDYNPIPYMYTCPYGHTHADDTIYYYYNTNYNKFDRRRPHNTKPRSANGCTKYATRHRTTQVEKEYLDPIKFDASIQMSTSLLPSTKENKVLKNNKSGDIFNHKTEMKIVRSNINNLEHKSENKIENAQK